jgi:hypothetical protein
MGGDCSQKLLLRRGLHSSPGRSRSSDQYEINNSIAKIGRPAGPISQPASFSRLCVGAVTFRCLSYRPVTIVSFETSSVRQVSSHRYSTLAAWSPLTRQNGSLPGRR